MSASKFTLLSSPVKSESDKKEYRVIKLDNQLITTIVSDKNVLRNENQTNTNDLNQGDNGSNATDEKLAAAALCIDVGAFCDPKDILGLSHFLEHMVFMGSEKFPTENDFDSFIKKGGGWTNAYTDYEVTMFYFECLEKHLPEALDKFSQFFIAPLMKREALTREREAVDSEFQIVKPTDTVRREQLLMRCAKKDSPVYYSFPWGNLITLKENICDDSLYKEVHEYRKKHYSANRMTLAIQARLPLDTLQNLAIKYFSSIPNNNLPKPSFNVFANGVFDTCEFNKIYYIKPVNDLNELNLTWSLPPLKLEYKSKPMRYVYNLIGDEGKGSILSYLKKHFWATALAAGNCEIGYDFNSMYSIFSVQVHLTEEGLKHVFDIIEVIFSYINLLKNIGPLEKIYDELKFISDTDFKFATESSACNITRNLASNMLLYPPVDVICGSQLYYEYNPEIISMVLNHFTSRKVNIAITSKKLPDNLKFDKTEKWFNTEYTDLDIPEEFLSKWENVAPYPELNIPPPNPYLTKHFNLLPESLNHPDYPQKLIDTEKYELWYKQDQKFKLPLAYYKFFLISPISVDSSKNATMLDMFISLLSFSIGEDLYPAYIASLGCSFDNMVRGIGFEVYGFDEKLPLLIKVMTKYITNLSEFINEDMFKALKETGLKIYHNSLLQPSSLTGEAFNKLLLKQMFTCLDTYNELSKLSYEDMTKFISNFHKTLYVKALVQGNVSPEIACETVKKVIEDLDYEEIPKEKYPKCKMLNVPLGERCLLIESFNKNDPNCTTLNYYQVGPFNFKDNAILDLVMRIINEPLYNVLRTKEQLGYDVSCEGSRTFEILGYSLYINSQANKFTTDYLDTRMEAFLKHSITLIEEIGSDGLEKIKEDLIKTKECSDHDLVDEVSRNWSEITSDEYIFDRTKHEIREIKNVTLDEIIHWWTRYNYFGNREHFKKISIQVAGHVCENKEDILENIDIKEATSKILGNNANVPEGKSSNYFIEDIDKFKEELTCYLFKN